MAKNIILILHIPVIHKGYLQILNKYKRASKILLLDDETIKANSEFDPDINTVPHEEMLNILNGIGFKNVESINESQIRGLPNDELVMINDSLSRSIAKKIKAKILWENIFLYWDADSIKSEESTEFNSSTDPQDINFIKQAYIEAQKSGDCWRQVGAVAVKDNKVITNGFNRGVPDNHNLAMLGNIRNNLKVGEQPELSPTLHAEKTIIASAAKSGLSIDGCDLYVTHFPCSDCAKWIVIAGIKNCFFGEGSSNIDGKRILENSGVQIIQVKLDK